MKIQKENDTLVLESDKAKVYNKENDVLQQYANWDRYIVNITDPDSVNVVRR